MPISLKSLLKLLVISAVFFSLSVSAKQPVVVVTIKPLYDIVAGLMEGVNQPLVLLQKDQLDHQLSKQQVKQLLAADMIIRVGDGLELKLGESLKQELNLLSSYTLTLSNYMPLLRKTSDADVSQVSLSERQQQSDLRFWADPKLLRMATRYITPQLVRMDPEHQEQYLENELHVLQQIKQLAQQTAAAINNLSVIEQGQLAQLNPYIAHRFVDWKQIPADIAQQSFKSKKHLLCAAENKKEFFRLSFDSLSLNSQTMAQNLKVQLNEQTQCLTRSLAVSL